MIGKTEVIQSKDFKIGLYTRSDILSPNSDLTPNCSDIKWYFDDSIGKRFGSSTTNAVKIIVTTTAGSGSGFIVGNALTNNLLSYWKLDESSGTRFDQIGNNNLSDINSVTAATGIRNNAANFVLANSQMLNVENTNLAVSQSNFSVAFWVYMNGTLGANLNETHLVNQTKDSNTVWNVYLLSDSLLRFTVLGTNGASATVTASSFGALVQGSFYNIVAWHVTNAHIGISVNLSADSSAHTTGVQGSGLVGLNVGASTGGFIVNRFNGRIDELGFWIRPLDSGNRIDLYAGGSGNTYTGASQATAADPWYSFDFGASSTRWLTVSAGTGIYASSNAGTTFVGIATSRTATYQFLNRSKNVLIATSDAYDVPLYWAGSAGTFAIALSVNTAPKAKFSNNYQGFLILLNSQDSNGVISNRRFSYVDENLQLTSAFSGFDIPSSADDEVTGSFILNKFLYVHTKFTIFRMIYSAGNPDWTFNQVANFGFVPRTVKVFSIKGSQVAMGLDWDRRLRIFYGYESDIVSDNVENANDYCDFAMQNISLVGSGLTVSNAEFDGNEYEYRLNLAIGPQSNQTTTALVLNARTLAIYPYSNQPYNTMCMASSAGRNFLMAFDRSGFCHILNSGNLDSNSIPINEVYDSPILFKSSPSEVTKNKQINFFFTHESSGKIYYQERFDLSRTYSQVKPLRDYLGNTDLTGTEDVLQILRTVDLPSVQNNYQFRLTSSSGTADPWKLTHFDLFNSSLGVGRGK